MRILLTGVRLIKLWLEAFEYSMGEIRDLEEPYRFFILYDIWGKL